MNLDELDRLRKATIGDPRFPEAMLEWSFAIRAAAPAMIAELRERRKDGERLDWCEKAAVIFGGEVVDVIGSNMRTRIDLKMADPDICAAMGGKL